MFFEKSRKMDIALLAIVFLISGCFSGSESNKNKYFDTKVQAQKACEKDKDNEYYGNVSGNKFSSFSPFCKHSSETNQYVLRAFVGELINLKEDKTQCEGRVKYIKEEGISARCIDYKRNLESKKWSFDYNKGKEKFGQAKKFKNWDQNNLNMFINYSKRIGLKEGFYAIEKTYYTTIKTYTYQRLGTN